MNKDPKDYVNSLLRCRAYHASYAPSITPMLPQEDWNKPKRKVFPPIRLREAGRPRPARKKYAYEPNSTRRCQNRCGKCQGFGHNSRGFQGGPIASQVREARGGGTQAMGGSQNKGGRPRSRPEVSQNPNVQSRKIGRASYIGAESHNPNVQQNASQVREA